MAEGRVIDTRILDAEAMAAFARDQRADGSHEIGMLVEHPEVAFVSYPHEWPADMLRAAALLTLDLADGLLPSQLGLKDATPHNILFRGTRPVFVDILSFESRDPREHTWLAYTQFVRTFVLPLLLYARLGLTPLQVLGSARDGIDPERLVPMLGFVRRLLPPFLGLVTLPAWLGRAKGAQESGTRRRLYDDPGKAQYVLSWQLRLLRRRVSRITFGRRSNWSSYEETGPYSTEAAVGKEAAVRAGLARFTPEWVLDVGCNTGRYSVIAAESGAQVVAIDSDEAVVGALFREADARSLSILPLVVDLARPTPALGWRNGECRSFLERASGRFDVVLMLAVVHHLLVTEGIPLDEIVDLASRLAGRGVIVELVPRDDPMFERIARGRDALYAWFDRSAFESAWSRHFEILESRVLPGSNRVVYTLAKS